MLRKEKVIELQKELITLLFSQIIDLTMMSKIELGDDVINEVTRLREEIKNASSEE